MKFLNHKLWRQLLVLVPMILLICCGTAYLKVNTEVQEALLEEKFSEKQQSVALLAAQIDAYVVSPAYKAGYGQYVPILSAGMAQIDAQPYTFAALYNTTLGNLSARTPSYSSSFEPLDDVAFAQTVRMNNEGTYLMLFAPEGEAEREMHVYFRWIPTDDTVPERYLTVVAVSKYSVENMLPASVWVLPGMVCLVMTLATTAAIYLLAYLGDIYVSRKRPKWRGE